MSAKPKAHKESSTVAERISRMKDFFFHDEVSNNKNRRLSCFMTSVNYFRAIFENLSEGSKVFDSLPNAKTEQIQQEA